MRTMGARCLVLVAVAALALSAGACSSSGGDDADGATGDETATTGAAGDDGGTALPDLVCLTGPEQSGSIPEEDQVEVDCD